MTRGELSAVDYVVVQFPRGASNFPAELATEVASLVSSGIVRVLDLFVLSKDMHGVLRVFDLDDLEEVVELEGLPVRRSTLVDRAHLDRLGGELAPGTTAGVIVWEQLWASPFADAMRRVGGHLVGTGHLPPDATSDDA